ncbi:MAG: MerR family transcriptional regulator [Candidatus Cyclobacteriaceae bacterium M3_2C_046]
MCVYSIKDLEHLSGIKAHTLRIWEQRYNFIKPKRTNTNIRFYDDRDLKLVLNISLLKNNGFKISKIAKMSEDEMNREVLKITEKKLSYAEQIHALTLCMVEMDENRFEKIMATSILQLGFERTMISIIFPFFHRIGVLWQTGSINPAHEHFISSLVRQKLLVAIDGQFVTSTEESKKFMLFLPEGEMHEISLLFASYLIKARKNKVIYLGQNLPFQDLHNIYELHHPNYLFTVITSAPGLDAVQEYVKKLGESFPQSEILLTGYQVIGQDLKCPSNVTILNKLDDLIDFVEELNNKITAS